MREETDTCEQVRGPKFTVDIDTETLNSDVSNSRGDLIIQIERRIIEVHLKIIHSIGIIQVCSEN